MSCAALYNGDKNFCMIFKQGEDVVDFLFTVLNKDGTPFDFTGLTQIQIEVYSSESLARQLAVLTDLIPNVNVLTFNMDWVDLDQPLGTTYQQMTYLDANLKIRTLEFGPSTII